MPRKRSSKQEKVFLFFLLVAAVLMLVVFVFSVYASSVVTGSIKDYSGINATLNIGDYVGFNLDRDKIHFGTIRNTGYSERGISLTPQSDGFVHVTAEGSLGDWLYLGRENTFPVSAGENVSMVLYASPDRGVSHGFYEAEVHIYLLEEPPGWVVERFLSGSPLPVVSEDVLSGPRVTVNIPDMD